MKQKILNEQKLGPPEPYDPKNQDHNDPTKYKLFSGTVWDHVMETLRANRMVDPLVNLSCLLHDIGKAVTLDFKDGQPTYYGHDEEGINLVNTIADRLKMSNIERESLIYVVANHMRFHKILGMKSSKIVKLVSDGNWDLLVNVAKADEFARGHKAMSKEDFQKVVDTAIEIKKKYGDKMVNKMIKLVNGNDVVRLTGIPPGPKVGAVIKKVTEWILDSGTDDQNIINNKIREVGKEI